MPHIKSTMLRHKRATVQSHTIKAMVITVTEWRICGNKSHKLTIDTDCIHEQLSVITDYIYIFMHSLPLNGGQFTNLHN